MKLNEIVLNETTSIYSGKYDWGFSKDNFLKRIEQNVLISNYSHDNTSILIIDCPEFSEIKKLGYDLTKGLSNLNTWDGARASKTWIYRQNAIKNKEYYHQHIHTTQLPYSNINAPIINDWTFVFYLQVPTDLIGEEGMIFFKVGNEPYKYQPTDGDFIIFPGDLPHLVKSSSGSKTERLSICGNISFNIPQRTKNKTII